MDVTLIGRNAEAIAAMRASRRNEKVLPGIDLPQNLAYSAEIEAVRGAGIVLFAMPSQAQREAARTFAPLLAPGTAVVICAKGMEKGTGRLLTDVLEEELPRQHIAVLSGPGFAADIARGLPTAMVVAAATIETAATLAHALSGPTFRLYPSADRIGVQLGGALKNVLAIACGIVEGAGLGDSARAALISRGLAEMSRFVAAHGGDAATVTGLSGLGDLVLTGTSHQSRNLRFGIELGRNGNADNWSGDLVEGAFAAGRVAPLVCRAGKRGNTKRHRGLSPPPKRDHRRSVGACGQRLSSPTTMCEKNPATRPSGPCRRAHATAADQGA